jgi:hypothetical protein
MAVNAGMVANARAPGRTSRAKMLHSSHVFSHAHERMNFIGNEKLAFITPAKISRHIPPAVLCIPSLLHV